MQIKEHELLALCKSEELSVLCFHRLSRSTADDWPASLRDVLCELSRVEVGAELLRGNEIRAVLSALARAGVRAVLIKGAPLAYTVYDAPALRPRDDTDLLIAEVDVAAARHVMASLGYVETVYCGDLFWQFEVRKVDRFGVSHVFDLHWKISTQPVFHDVLNYDDVNARAEPVPALGPDALTLGPVDALVLGCVHPVMHHRNAERALWMYDIHLLAERLSGDQFNEFADLACSRKVAAICVDRLRRAQILFKSAVPQGVLDRLAGVGAGEPSAAYLASERRWHHELLSSVQALSSLGARTRLLREVLLPSRDYMLGIYGFRGKPLAALLLPALHLHRNLRGAWKVLSGKK